ncbi:uncharacterized protein LOC120919076 isoform X2 [Rana temporaria]|nr:uncharacterized protein LOC120919076 isoform X2 [Rana temporaria]
MSEYYIHQVPARMTEEVGQSASIQCWVEKDIDIREISLYKRNSLIFTLNISRDNLSKTLEVSGAYNQFTWILNQGGGGTFPCKTASSPESPTMYCHSPGEKDTHIYVWNGTEVASFSVENILDYESRIRLSGTVRNLTIWLTDLSVSDRDGYTCRGKADHIGDITGHETSLSVENPPTGHGCIVIGFVAAAGGFLTGLAIFCCLKEKIYLQLNNANQRRQISLVNKANKRKNAKFPQSLALSRTISA